MKHKHMTQERSECLCKYSNWSVIWRVSWQNFALCFTLLFISVSPLCRISFFGLVSTVIRESYVLLIKSSLRIYYAYFRQCFFNSPCINVSSNESAKVFRFRTKVSWGDLRKLPMPLWMKIFLSIIWHFDI